MGSGTQHNSLIRDKDKTPDTIKSRREIIFDLKAGSKVDKGPKTALEESTPKTQCSKRTISILPELVKELKLHQLQQNGEEALARDAYVDSKLIFPNELGEPTDERT